jgi:hypothetical protein
MKNLPAPGIWNHLAKISTRCRALAAALVLVAPSALSATWYISPTGSDNNSGTQASPLASIMRAQQLASSGDTVLINGGTYYPTNTNPKEQNVYVPVNLINKNGITYEAMPGTRPVFNFSQVNPPGLRTAAFWVTATGVTFQGFDIVAVQENITNSNNQSIGMAAWGCTSCTWNQVNVHDADCVGFYLEEVSASNLWYRCDSYNNAGINSYSYGNADGFGCHPAAGGRGNVLRECRAWNDSDDGYDCIQASETVTFDHCWSYMNGNNGGNGNGFKVGGWGSTDQNAIPNPIPSHIVRFCLSAQNHGNGGFYANHQPAGPGAPTSWTNNTAFNNSGPDFDMLQRTPPNYATNAPQTDSNDISGTNEVMHFNLAYQGTVTGDYNLTGSPLVTSNSWSESGITVSAADFVSTTASQMTNARAADGSLPVITFMHLTNGSDLVGLGCFIVPPAPTGLGATAGNNQVALSWNTSSGATSYNVKRSTTSGSGYTTIASPTTTSYTDTTAANGTTYYYVVTALNPGDESANSSQVSATPEPSAPPTPTGLNATPGNNQVALGWNTSSGATSYNVKRSTTSGSGYATIASPTTTSYTDTTAVNGTTYYYVVSAVNTGGESANSSQVSATPSGGGGSGFTSPIVLVNPGFETNTSGVVFTSKVSTGFDVSGNDVAGWLNAGSTYASSGVDYAGDSGVVVHGGSVTAYCDQGDSGAYQITGYPMQAGDQLTLTWWAKSSYNNAAQSVSLLSGASPGSAFGSLTTLATSTAALNNTGNGGAYTQYTLTYTAGAADAGKYVAVSFLAPGTAGSWAMFDDFALSVTSLLPSPWASGDIGAVGVAGSASATTNGLFTVAGSGADIWGAGDQLRYVYQPASGDCSVQAEVLSVQNTQSHAKGGVMIRETLNTNSAMAMVDLTPSAGVEFVWRTNTAASAASTVVAGITAPNWVKVTRTGNSFVGYYSTNGTAWTVLGTNTITMGTGVYVGLPVCAHNNTVTCTATFTNVVATP